MSNAVTAVRNAATEHHFSGVVRLDHAGSTYTEAFGLAHRGFEVPNRADTQFAIASGTKGLTALTVVSLICDGSLTLETTARSVLGDNLPLVGDDVTIEHLLAHRSGIGDYIDEDDPDLGSNDYLMRSPVHLLESTEAFLPELDGYSPKFGAGEQFSYCNSGYMVLALIAERIGGTDFHDLIAERVLGPAGLTDTGFLRSDEPSGRMALGYLHDEGLRANVLHLPVRGNGDGGIYTTAADVHRFWEALFAGRIVPESWVTEMTRPRSDAPEESARYGLGFWLAAEGPEVRLVGQDAGVSFFTGHDPRTGSTLTVLANTADGAWPMINPLRDHLAEAVSNG